jgi:hypothetical protein
MFSGNRDGDRSTTRLLIEGDDETTSFEQFSSGVKLRSAGVSPGGPVQPTP